MTDGIRAIRQIGHLTEYVNDWNHPLVFTTSLRTRGVVIDAEFNGKTAHRTIEWSALDGVDAVISDMMAEVGLPLPPYWGDVIAEEAA